MKVHVKWSDIRAGKPVNTTECMVALALKRELGTAYASVGHTDATIAANGERVKVYLPQEVGKKIKFWDRFHFVLPFSFELQCSGFLEGHTLGVELPSANSMEPMPKTGYALGVA